MDITDKLISILQMVNDWLKFAEAKNAILLAFCGAGITVTVTYLSAATSILNSLQVGLLISLFFLSVSSLICSLSFLPKTDIEHFVWLRTKPTRKSKTRLSDDDNFYFFNCIKKYEPEYLLDAMNRLYFQSQVQIPYRKEDLDIASQITINSEIAAIKFTFFRVALWFLIFSILVLPVSLLGSLMIYHRL
ncbi:MAG: Pycsar system effector family protein [Nostoc sp.]|uniref:Pycsar system effector family protein n=1 Tax=Nostoc sp. TaxID=1180 RepID=UPI002FFA06D2